MNSCPFFIISITNIMYGRGNFHFIGMNPNESEMWSTGMLVQLEFTNASKIKFISTVAENGGILLMKNRNSAN